MSITGLVTQYVTYEHIPNYVYDIPHADPAATHAAELWQALLNGHWQITQRLVHGNAHYLLGVATRGKGLNTRERHIGAYAGAGHANKSIAYALGLSPSTITTHTLRMQQRFHLRSRCELASFFAPQGFRTTLAVTEIDAEPRLIGRCACVDTQQLGHLTEAEREVAALIATGISNAAIAAQRGSSARTIANQVQAVFRKLGVRSRAELAVRVVRNSGAEAALPH